MITDKGLLEFDKILTSLRKYAVSDLAKQAITELSPIDNQEIIETWLLEAMQAKTMIERYDETPMTGVLNVKEALTRSRIGATLSIEELLRIVSLVEAEGRNVAYIKKVRQLEIPDSALAHYYDELSTHPKLKQQISACINDKGQIYDDASPKLATVRKKIHIQEKRIEDKMNGLLHSEATKLTDSLITIRNNRLVLPVKSEYKNQFKGIVHDMSASKETVFIEPMICVELNNGLQGLQFEEQEAIEEILQELSSAVGEVADELLSNFSILTTLDTIFAKAKYAIAEELHAPVITKNEISLLRARHPLIPRGQVVANDIRFFDYRTIVITGPNTGGKTVALKTLGLLSTMLQSGIPIPVAEGSKTTIFANIFADIGDEQSIEQSLSTFSSHITKIITILRQLTPHSLVLLDELGSGTDPKEGASIAMAMLDELRTRNVYAMVTTHYPELKIYAYDLDDVVNASVEFDIESLKPTYRLQIGVPGTSNAIDIAQRLGLMPHIVKHARTVSLRFDNETVSLMKKLEKQSILLKQQEEENEALQAQLLEQIESVKQEKIQQKNAYNLLLAKAEKERDQQLAEGRAQIEEMIQELDQLRKQEGGFKDHVLADLKHQAKKMRGKEKAYVKTNEASIQVGDLVNVIPYQRQGEVTKIRNGQYEVQMGVLSGTFKETDLEFVERPQATPKAGHVQVSASTNVKVELDLRGFRFEEAMDELDKFVDNCVLNHLEFAYIIHGYGTGALRTGVQNYVKTNKVIKSSRPGGMNEGGSGVTVLSFR